MDVNQLSVCPRSEMGSSVLDGLSWLRFSIAFSLLCGGAPKEGKIGEWGDLLRLFFLEDESGIEDMCCHGTRSIGDPPPAIRVASKRAVLLALELRLGSSAV